MLSFDAKPSLYVNGVPVDTTQGFPATMSDDFSIGAAKNGAGNPDGLFLGASTTS